MGRQKWDWSPSDHEKQPQKRRKATDTLPTSTFSQVQSWLSLPYRRHEMISTTIYAISYSQLLQSSMFLSAFLSQTSGFQVRPQYSWNLKEIQGILKKWAAWLKDIAFNPGWFLMPWRIMQIFHNKQVHSLQSQTPSHSIVQNLKTDLIPRQEI